MIHPSYSELMEVINSTVEQGEQPLVQSRYSVVLATSKRARQIVDGDEPMVKNPGNKKPLSMAVEELYDTSLKILNNEEADKLAKEAADERERIEREIELEGTTVSEEE